MPDAPDEHTIYTIGHSAHGIETFVSLLKQHRISAVADVRSTPYSRRHPQYNRKELARELKAHEIDYVFLGKELGARSNDPTCYEDNRVKFGLLAKTTLFRSGIERIHDGNSRRIIALMCAEKDPLDCHRTILVARELVEDGADVAHILENGEVESHSAAIARLSEKLKLPEPDMVSTAQELEEQAYVAQERRIAYVDHTRGHDDQEIQK